MQALLRDGFGFASLLPAPEIERDGRRFPISFQALDGRAPVVIGGHDADIEAASQARFGDGRRKRSAVGLLQEWLNATAEALWGIAANGLVLRLMRDNASLTRPAWVEADLERIFVERRFADFSILWLLLHETRFGRADAPAADAPLEAWYAGCREQGTAARDALRAGGDKNLRDVAVVG